MYRVIGTCSQCGGKVVIPDVWGGIIPPTPTCQRCHATLEQPVITATPAKPPERHLFQE